MYPNTLLRNWIWQYADLPATCNNNLDQSLDDRAAKVPDIPGRIDGHEHVHATYLPARSGMFAASRQRMLGQKSVKAVSLAISAQLIVPVHIIQSRASIISLKACKMKSVSQARASLCLKCRNARRLSRNIARPPWICSSFVERPAASLSHALPSYQNDVVSNSVKRVGHASQSPDNIKLVSRCFLYTGKSFSAPKS